MGATPVQDQMEGQGTELQRLEGGMEAGPRQQAGGIITFLVMEGRNRGEEETEVGAIKTGMEEAEMEEETKMEETEMEEETRILEDRIKPKQEDRTEAKMEDKDKLKVEHKAGARVAPTRLEDNPQARSVLEMNCRPVLMSVQDLQPGCLVLVWPAVLRGVRQGNNFVRHKTEEK